MTGDSVSVLDSQRRFSRNTAGLFVAMLLTLAACAGLGALVVFDPGQAMRTLTVAGLVAFAPDVFMPGAFERMVALMLLTLPLYSAFVLDPGVTIRLSYLFGAAALVSAATRGRLRTTAAHEVWGLLGLFLCAVFASIVLNPATPSVPPLSASGLRGLPGLRPVAQAMQLFLMAGLLVVTVSFCRTRERFSAASNLLLLGGLFATLYGFYMFITLWGHLPFVDINNAMNTDFSFGYKEQNNSYFGGTIPRPRSTFPEPANFANFLLFVMAFMFVRLRRSSTHGQRLLWGLTTGATILLFFFAVNSRGAIYGALLALIATVVLFARSFGEFRATAGRLVLWTGGLALVIALFVQLSYVGGVPKFVEYSQLRLTSALDASNKVATDWQIVGEVFRTHPLYGVGFGNLTYYVGQVEGVQLMGVTDAGGLYQRLLAEVGIPGTMLYVLFLTSILLRLWRVGRTSTEPHYVNFSRALFFAISADSIQRVSLVGIATDAYLWVALGLAIALVELANAAACPDRDAAVGRRSGDAVKHFQSLLSSATP